ncbi:MAG: tyrosine-type recombinase/integrase [Candidatus Methanoperedens sp.]|nr:tyrosine-type recombinase/integrase [Candidatus Methanoperedens sp.]
MNLIITYKNALFDAGSQRQAVATSKNHMIPTQPVTEDLLSGYLLDCKTRGMQSHTCETYTSNLKYFLKYLSEHHHESNPTKITEDILKAFLVHIRDEKRYSKSTINGYFACIFGFHEFLLYRKIITHNPVAPFRKRYMSLLKYRKGDTKEGCSRQFISIEDMARLIKAAEKKRHIVMPYRDACINIMLAKTGIRRTEAINLDITDVDLEKKQLTIKPHPKRQNCLAFFDDEVKHYLELYLPHRHPDKPALFQTRFGYRLDRTHFLQAITFPAKSIGLHNPNGKLNQKFTPHNHRHWYTSVLRGATPPVDAVHIKWLRGDVLSEAWNIYDHIDPGKIRKEYDRAMPRLF